MLQMRPGFRENIRNGCTIATTGAGPVITNTQGVFNSSCLTNNDTAGYLVLSPANTFAFGLSNFTIEYRYNPLVTSNQTLFGVRSGLGVPEGPYISISAITGGGLHLFVNSTPVIYITNVFTVGVWTSVALVRYSSQTKFYIDGVAIGTIYTDTNNYGSIRPVIGTNDDNNGGLLLNGYFDEFRVSNIARYTGNYTPATQPFIDDLNTICLLHFDGSNGSQTFVDDNS